MANSRTKDKCKTHHKNNKFLRLSPLNKSQFSSSIAHHRTRNLPSTTHRATTIMDRQLLSSQVARLSSSPSKPSMSAVNSVPASTTSTKEKTAPANTHLSKLRTPPRTLPICSTSHRSTRSNKDTSTPMTIVARTYAMVVGRQRLFRSLRRWTYRWPSQHQDSSLPWANNMARVLVMETLMAKELPVRVWVQMVT